MIDHSASKTRSEDRRRNPEPDKRILNTKDYPTHSEIDTKHRLMTFAQSKFTKVRWIMTTLGIVLYVVDIVSDCWLLVKYFRDGLYLWCGLTLLFIVKGSLCTSIFSYAWFRDDTKQGRCFGLKKIQTVSLHVLQLGILTRYIHLLKRSAKGLWGRRAAPLGPVEEQGEQQDLFAMATDLSMLRLFETFLESVPQLVLQLFIILGHHHCSVIQYISMVMSFLSIAWATVDYRRCFRRSLPHIKEMPCGLPTLVYLLYKLLTITARILSLTLLMVLSSYSALAVVLVWLLGALWAYVEQTDFCTSRAVEALYRTTVGFILVFTFFNIKGQDTRVPMAVYYILYFVQNLCAPVLLFLLKPEVQVTLYFLPIAVLIAFSNAMGLGFLVLYYSLLHPRGKIPIADEVDSIERQEPKRSKTRFSRFLQI